MFQAFGNRSAMDVAVLLCKAVANEERDANLNSLVAGLKVSFLAERERSRERERETERE